MSIRWQVLGNAFKKNCPLSTAIVKLVQGQSGATKRHHVKKVS